MIFQLDNLKFNVTVRKLNISKVSFETAQPSGLPIHCKVIRPGTITSLTVRKNLDLEGSIKMRSGNNMSSTRLPYNDSLELKEREGFYIYLT